MSIPLCIHEEYLSKEQVKYELQIRTAFEDESWALRRSKLKHLLKEEVEDDYYPNLRSHLDFSVDFETLKSDFSQNKVIFEDDDRFTSDQIRQLESIVEHLYQRMERMNPPEGQTEFKDIKTEISQWRDRVIDFYKRDPKPSNDNDGDDNRRHRSYQNGTTNDTKGAKKDPISRDRPSRRTIPLDPSLLDSGRNWHRQSNFPRESFVNTGSRHRYDDEYAQYRSPMTHHQRSDEVRSSHTIDSSRSDVSRRSSFQRNTERTDIRHERQIPLRPSFRRASDVPTPNEFSWHSANSVTVLKWRFHFSGLTPTEDPKGLELDHFIQKVEDYGRSENITESEILDKIQHLLKGPAEDWYVHARRRIRSWNEFVQGLKKRFASVTGPDAIQQMILQKKQQHGEYTLRFIDQFINLIDKLPHRVSETRALDWILGGIRPEVAILARTANIRSPYDLSTYVKRNFGTHDKYFDRHHRAFNPNSRQYQRNVNALENYDNYYLSDSGSDYEEPMLQEINKISYSKQKKKKESKSTTNEQSKDKQSPQHALPVNQAPAHTPNHTCCLHSHAHTLSHECSHSSERVHSPSPSVFSCQHHVSQPYYSHCPTSPMPMAELAPIGHVSNRNLAHSHNANHLNSNDPTNTSQNTLTCPYCKGFHSYRFCTLPPEQKPKHCFKCGAKDQTTRTCSCNVNNASSTNPNNTTNPNPMTNNQLANTTHVALLESIPKKVYVESLIYYPNADARPHISIIANGISLTGLLDTGAHATVFGRDLYEGIVDWRTELQPIETVIITADGKPHSVLGALLLEYSLNGTKRVVPTLVADIQMKRPIFGMNFQRCFGIGLSFTQLNSIEIDPPKTDVLFEPHELTKEQKDQLDLVIKNIPSLKDSGQLNCSTQIEHEIDTGNNNPVYQKPYLFSFKTQEKIRAEIVRLLQLGIIEKIPYSHWLNAVIPVPKSDGSIRLCMDARKLNAITNKNQYPQMNIDRILSRIGPAQYFSSIDLKDAYYQIPLKIEDREKTAFAIHGVGTFQYRRMPMGLVNAAATLCHLIERTFNVETEPEIFVYLDDFIVCTKTFDRHIELLNLVANKLNQVGLSIGLKKSKFCMKRLVFLGHVIDRNGIAMDPSRTEAIQNIKRPLNVKQVRRFIGMASWYRKFIPNFATLASPLTSLTKNNGNDFVWTTQHDEAFLKLKHELSQANILDFPIATLPFFIECSSSEIGISAMLYQKIDSEKRIISYMSAKLSTAQRKFHPIERSCLSVILALEKYRTYTQGNKVTVITDNGSISWLQSCKDPTGRMARWSMRLQAHDFELQHRKLSENSPVCVLCSDMD